MQLKHKRHFISAAEKSRRNKFDLPILEKKKVKILYSAICRCPVQTLSNISALLKPWYDAYVLWKSCTSVRCVFCDTVQGGFSHKYAVAHGTTGWQWLHLSLTLFNSSPVTVIFCKKTAELRTWFYSSKAIENFSIAVCQSKIRLSIF